MTEASECKWCGPIKEPRCLEMPSKGGLCCTRADGHGGKYHVACGGSGYHALETWPKTLSPAQFATEAQQEVDDYDNSDAHYNIEEMIVAHLKATGYDEVAQIFEDTRPG